MADVKKFAESLWLAFVEGESHRDIAERVIARDAALDRAQWRRVEDGLPDHESAVLVWYCRACVTGSYFGGSWVVNHYETSMVTHWRPLPEGPGDGD